MRTAKDAFEAFMETVAAQVAERKAEMDALPTDSVDYHIESGAYTAYKSLHKYLTEMYAEGFADDPEYVALREKFTTLLEAATKQGKLIDSKQQIISNYEALFDGDLPPMPIQ